MLSSFCSWCILCLKTTFVPYMGFQKSCSPCMALSHISIIHKQKWSDMHSGTCIITLLLSTVAVVIFLAIPMLFSTSSTSASLLLTPIDLSLSLPSAMPVLVSKWCFFLSHIIATNSWLWLLSEHLCLLSPLLLLFHNVVSDVNCFLVIEKSSTRLSRVQGWGKLLKRLFSVM